MQSPTHCPQDDDHFDIPIPLDLLELLDDGTDDYK
jgi:hypothetical protein